MMKSEAYAENEIGRPTVTWNVKTASWTELENAESYDVECENVGSGIEPYILTDTTERRTKLDTYYLSEEFLSYLSWRNAA